MAGNRELGDSSTHLKVNIMGFVRLCGRESGSADRSGKWVMVRAADMVQRIQKLVLRKRRKKHIRRKRQRSKAGKRQRDRERKGGEKSPPKRRDVCLYYLRSKRRDDGPEWYPLTINPGIPGQPVKYLKGQLRSRGAHNRLTSAAWINRGPYECIILLLPAHSVEGKF